MPKILKFAEKCDPILREVMPEVLDFNDFELKKNIDDMCYSILPKQLKAELGSFESAAGMAANQWGIRRRVFIFTPDGSDPKEKKEVMINPSYIPYLLPGESEPRLEAAYEGCFSIPLATGIVNRYVNIIATYYTVTGTKVEKIMQGWEARVFQHETDHLDGKLYDGRLDNFAGPECLQRIEFKDKEEMEQYWEKVREERSARSSE